MAGKGAARKALANTEWPSLPLSATGSNPPETSAVRARILVMRLIHLLRATAVLMLIGAARTRVPE